MAFTVQTLPPTDDANAYIDVAYFRAYNLERGRDFSNETLYPDAMVQIWIINATQYLDLRFEYYGYRVTATQGTEFPRSNLYNSRGDQLTGIPRCVKQATAEYAYRAKDSALLADPDTDGSGQTIKSKSETVGPISERVEYVSHEGFQMPAYPFADKLLTSQGIVASGMNQGGGLSSGDTARS